MNQSQIPKSLQPLAWEEMKDDIVWSDGEQLLVAVPVKYNGNDVYEFYVIFIRCGTFTTNESYFCIDCYDEEWCCVLEDVDYFIKIC